MNSKTKQRMPFWEIRQALNRDGVLQLYIYGDVEGNWYDWWDDEEHVSETSADFFRQELSRYPDVTEIEIFINSYGGEVFEGTAIYNQLRRHPAHKTVYIDGFACSIASVIAMAGDEVIMPANTMMFIHNMWMGAVGNAEQLRKAADDLDVINAAGRQAYLQKAGDKISEERLIEMMDAETWLTAQECVELGLADRVAEQEADLTAIAGMMQQATQRAGAQKMAAHALRPDKAPAAPAAKAEPAEPPAGEPEGEKQTSIMETLAKIKI